MVTINGHTLTTAELRALDTVRALVNELCGDSSTDLSCSPRGDGKWVYLPHHLPRSNRTTALKRAVWRLHGLGVLAACEIAFKGGWLKLMPIERIKEAESQLGDDALNGRMPNS